MLKLLSWNLAHRDEAWALVMDSGADVALLQEAGAPPSDVAGRLECEPEQWRTGGRDANRPWRTSIACVNRSIELRRYPTRLLDSAPSEALAVSCSGTLAAADVRDPVTLESYTVISMYAPWESPHVDAAGDWIYADASAHRLVSDLSVFVGTRRRHRIIAAGDLNILHGHGEYGRPYWAARYQSVFDRLSAIGLTFVGPQYPNGRQADPWPDELPVSSLNVPTYHTNRQTPSSATRQFDFVFASTPIAGRVKAVAKNGASEWGPSDHCRISITVSDGA